jgi:hypothetical protein
MKEKAMPPRKTNPDSGVVFARRGAVLAHGGKRVGVRAGEPWDANDPLVEQYPDNFVSRVPAMRSTVDPRGFREYDDSVERATRAPGEKRTTRRTSQTESGEQGAASDEE